MSRTPPGLSRPTYGELLRVGEFRVLLVARALVVTGVSVSFLALGSITYQATGSPVLTSLAMFGGPLVQIVASTQLGATQDLLRPRSAIVLGGLATMTGALLQAIPGLPWQLRFVILALPYIVLAATTGSVMALAADILGTERFVLGRSMLNMVNGVMQIAGYGIGGLLLLTFSTSALFLIAAAVTLLATLVVRWKIADHRPRAAGEKVVARTRRVNRELLGSPIIRPLLLASWIPGGLASGCEALFVPFSPTHAGLLFSATAGGMFVGDVVVGRLLRPATRDRLLVPLLALTCLPYVGFAWVPGLALAAGLGGLGAFGYAALLPLSDRLVGHTDESQRGQMFGLWGTGIQVSIAVGSLLAGAVAQLLGSRHTDIANAAAVVAVLGLATTALLVRGLRRSGPDRLVVL